MPFGREVDLGPGHIVLDGAQQHRAAPLFSAHVYCGQTVAHLSYCLYIMAVGARLIRLVAGRASGW